MAKLKIKINKIMNKILGVKRPLKLGVKRPGCETTGNPRNSQDILLVVINIDLTKPTS